MALKLYQCNNCKHFHHEIVSRCDCTDDDKFEFTEHAAVPLNNIEQMLRHAEQAKANPSLTHHVDMITTSLTQIVEKIR